MSFSRQITDWTANVSEESAELSKAIIFELFSSVIEDTPVDTGRLRGNWVITKGIAPITEPLTDGGENKLSEVANFIAKVDFTQPFNLFLTNNLPYAERIEYGYSKQAPAGMVRKNYIRITSNLNSR